LRESPHNSHLLPEAQRNEEQDRSNHTQGGTPSFPGHRHTGGSDDMAPGCTVAGYDLVLRSALPGTGAWRMHFYDEGLRLRTLQKRGLGV